MQFANLDIHALQFPAQNIKSLGVINGGNNVAQYSPFAD